MNNNQIMVSVCCMVYNHEKYLRQCLDGFVMQKTNFKFEVLIHDDASTDSSPDIIREYEEKYPDMIKPIYQTENQYSKGVKISWVYQYPRATGKYIAFCEGDDFWTDSLKLQKQYDAMENCPKASICTHRVKIVEEDGSPSSLRLISEPEKSGIITSEEMLNCLVNKDLYLFHTTSFFIRGDIIRSILVKQPDFMTHAPVGDVPLMIYCASLGDGVFLDESMSCYRTMSIGSWSERIRLKQYSELCKKRAIMWHYVGQYLGEEYQKATMFNQKKYEFMSWQWSSAYKNMLKGDYRSFFDKLSFKERTYVWLNAYFPTLMRLYRQVMKNE